MFGLAEDVTKQVSVLARLLATMLSGALGWWITHVSIAAAMLGFFVVNWPMGKIFLGDGGSYFGGFALAWVALLMVERNTQVTPFAALLICIYPVVEVLFSIYRRRLRKANPGLPDKQHLHSLIMRRYVRRKVPVAWQNPVTGLILALMTVPAVLMAFYFQHSAAGAAVVCLGFMLGYVGIYPRIVRLHWCSPISFLFVKPSY